MKREKLSRLYSVISYKVRYGQQISPAIVFDLIENFFDIPRQHPCLIGRQALAETNNRLQLGLDLDPTARDMA